VRCIVNRTVEKSVCIEELGFGTGVGFAECCELRGKKWIPPPKISVVDATIAAPGTKSMGGMT